MLFAAPAHAEGDAGADGTHGRIDGDVAVVTIRNDDLDGADVYRAGLIDGFDLAARPRWPLDRSQPAMLGSGKKGAKA